MALATCRIGLVGLWHTIAFDEMPANRCPRPPAIELGASHETIRAIQHNNQGEERQ